MRDGCVSCVLHVQTILAPVPPDEQFHAARRQVSAPQNLDDVPSFKAPVFSPPCISDPCTNRTGQGLRKLLSTFTSVPTELSSSVPIIIQLQKSIRRLQMSLVPAV